jgi:hypothetical protein
MSNAKEQVRIELTPEQKALIKDLTGKNVEALELGVTELEERIAPSCVKGTHIPEVGI